MFVSAILLAAGRGKRFGARISKPMVMIGSKPLISYSLETLSSSRWIDEIVVVVNRANRGAIQALVARKRFDKVARIVLGGKERQDSVACGLDAASAKADLVAIHDSARPFLTCRLIEKLVVRARADKAAIAAVPVKATIKKVTLGGRARARYVHETLDRSLLWEVQTPQVFEKKLIVEAYRRFSRVSVTDDAALVEKAGARVSVVEGRYTNIKVTTPDDAVIAAAIAKAGYL